MQTFHFHIREAGRLIVDSEGMALADSDAARHEALRGARSLLSEAVSKGRLPLADAVVVTDADGKMIWEISFAAAVSETALALANPLASRC